MMQYPYNSSQVLTDSIFVMYGGQIGTSTSLQREAAYLLAEDQMTEHLASFIVPTTITGTVSYIRNGIYETEYGNVTRVFSAMVDRVKQYNPMTIETFTGTYLIVNGVYGYIGMYFDYSGCGGGCGGGGNGYRYYAAYESGLSTGTANQPAMRAALTLAAQINLNEMDVSLSNEGVADVGVQRFSNQAYTEDRKTLGNTVFGNSAMAQRIARLTRKYRVKTAIGFR